MTAAGDGTPIPWVPLLISFLACTVVGLLAAMAFVVIRRRLRRSAARKPQPPLGQGASGRARPRMLEAGAQVGHSRPRTLPPPEVTNFARRSIAVGPSGRRGIPATGESAVADDDADAYVFEEFDYGDADGAPNPFAVPAPFDGTEPPRRPPRRRGIPILDAACQAEEADFADPVRYFETQYTGPASPECSSCSDVPSWEQRYKQAAPFYDSREGAPGPMPRVVDPASAPAPASPGGDVATLTAAAADDNTHRHSVSIETAPPAEDAAGAVGEPPAFAAPAGDAAPPLPVPLPGEVVSGDQADASAASGSPAEQELAVAVDVPPSPAAGAAVPASSGESEPEGGPGPGGEY